MNQRVTMISGASRGIGLAIAQHLHANGYCLSLGARNIVQLKKLTSQFAPERTHLFQYEAKNKEAPAQWVSQTVRVFGKVDCIINNAGILKTMELEEANEETLDEMWEVNVKAPLRLIRETFPHLKKSGKGRIINIVSLSGKRTYGGSTFGYAMSKHAMMALTHSSRQIGWEHGIRATAICPGYTNTDMVKSLTNMKRQDMTQPKDVAKLVHTILELPNNASVAELTISCRPEPTI